MVYKLDKSRASDLGLVVFEPGTRLIRIPAAATPGAETTARASPATEDVWASGLTYESSRSREKALTSCVAEVSDRCSRGAQSSCVIQAVKSCRCTLCTVLAHPSIVLHLA